MHSALKNRAGFGLPVAMAAIAVIGGIIAAASFSSMQSYRLDRNALVQERALAAAEEGQARIVRDWSTAWNGTADGATVVRDYSFTDGSTARAVVTRLNPHTFWVASEGAASQTSRQQNARRRTNMLLRLNVPNLRISGAFSAREATRATGNTTLNGDDRGPTGWDCDAAGTSVGAIATDSLNDAGTAGNCSGDACLTSTGGGKRVADSTLRDTSTFSQFGGLNYDSLKVQAATGGLGQVFNIDDGDVISQVQPSYNLDGSCNTSDAKNWGDPTRNLLLPGRCETYFPVVRLRGDLNDWTTISGFKGQGILIVDGNLELAGQFQWYGPIIVRGKVRLNGNAGSGGIKVFGGILAANLNCSSSDPVGSPCNDLAGTSSVQFSRCAITAAVTRNAMAVPATRHWADLF